MSEKPKNPKCVSCGSKGLNYPLDQENWEVIFEDKTYAYGLCKECAKQERKLKANDNVKFRYVNLETV